MTSFHPFKCLLFKQNEKSLKLVLFSTRNVDIFLSGAGIKPIVRNCLLEFSWTMITALRRRNFEIRDSVDLEICIHVSVKSPRIKLVSINLPESVVHCNERESPFLWQIVCFAARPEFT